MTVSFVDCQADLLPSLRGFMARVYRPEYILCHNEKLFSWQFGEVTNGNGGAHCLKLARLEDEVVGCLGYIPVDVSLGGQVVRGAWMVNWMVDPLQRRLGLGPLLMREVTSQFDVALNVGPNPAARDLLVRMGWTDFGELTRYVCVLDVRAAGALTRTGTLEWPLFEPSLEEGKLPRGISIRLIQRFSDEATQLWDAVCGLKGAGTRRSSKFLNRRYADHPSFNYRLFELRHGERLSGLAVYRLEQVQDMPVRLGRIVELVSQPRWEECLLRALLEDARSQEIAVVDFFCSSTRLAKTMIRQGFRRSEEAAAWQLPALFQPIDRRWQGISFMAYLRNAPQSIDVHDWYVTKGDGDQDRPN